jgi:predicted secreted protein
MNGTNLLLYIDNDKLLYSKSHSFSFNADAVDVSVKQSDIIGSGESINWEDANFNWENADDKWKEVLKDIGVTGWTENMYGYRSSNFSAEGLYVIGANFETDVTTRLDNFIITGQILSFQILDNNLTSIFSGNCYMSSYELVADNEGAMFYNVDFSVTSGVS